MVREKKIGIFFKSNIIKFHFSYFFIVYRDDNMSFYRKSFTITFYSDNFILIVL